MRCSTCVSNSDEIASLRMDIQSYREALFDESDPDESLRLKSEIISIRSMIHELQDEIDSCDCIYREDVSDFFW